MTEVLDRIESELIAAARRRAAPVRRRRRPAVVVATAVGLVLAGGGAVAAVSTNSGTEGEQIERLPGAPATPGGLVVDLVVDTAAGRYTVTAFEAERGWGVRGSEALCVTGGTAKDRYGVLVLPCWGPWPLTEGPGLLVVPAAGPSRSAPRSHVTQGLVAPGVARAELVLPDGTRRSAELTAPFIVALSPQPGEPVPGAPRDAASPGGTVSARLLAGATVAEPEAALLTYADGRTERIPSAADAPLIECRLVRRIDQQVDTRRTAPAPAPLTSNPATPARRSRPSKAHPHLRPTQPFPTLHAADR